MDDNPLPPSTIMDPFDPPLDKPRHLRYWQRCVRTLLPHHYTSMDSTRLSLGFFIVASIDLLTPSPSTSSSTSTTASTTPDSPPDKPLLTPSDRRRLRQWVLSCQHPQGGFCGSPTHVLPPEHQHDSTENAHIGGTYFALLLLALLADNDDDTGPSSSTRASAASAFAGVDRVRTLRWLRRLQRPEDGSFGEIVYDPPLSATATATATATTTSGDNDNKKTNNNGNGDRTGDDNARSKPMIAGGKDMRYCYLAAAVRWMLRGASDDADGDDDYVEDIDVPALVAHIRRGQTYDGGFAESWRHESHAGYGYCAVAALALLDRPLESSPPTAQTGTGGQGHGEMDGAAAATASAPWKSSQTVREGVADMQGFVSWLMSRQFAYVQGSGAGDGDGDDDDDDPEIANFRLADLSLADTDAQAQYIGFNGRCNKVADTCYTWWTLGSLAVLGVLDPSQNHNDNTNTLDPAALKAQRAFLLEKTQHLIGGFGKHPGSPPDVGHGCLGLAALATMGDPGLKKLDPALCVSVDVVRRIEKARTGLLKRGRQRMGADKGGGGEDFKTRLVGIAVKMGGGKRPEWLDAMAEMPWATAEEYKDNQRGLMV